MRVSQRVYICNNVKWTLLQHYNITYIYINETRPIAEW